MRILGFPGEILNQFGKKADKGVSEWLPALLELSIESNQLLLLVYPSEPIYEAVDEDERPLRFPLEIYKRCFKLNHNRTQSKDSDGEQTSATQRRAGKQPAFQILLLQKRIILRGHQLKIGFDDPVSQSQFYDRIKAALRKKSQEKRRRKLARLHMPKSTSNIETAAKLRNTKQLLNRNPFDEIEGFLTENQIYETHSTGGVKVRVIPTDLSFRLKISGVYMLEIKGFDIILMDYINLSVVNTWQFRSIQSFGFHAGKFYLLTGSRCQGGRGLLSLSTEKGEVLVEHLINLMQEAANESLRQTSATSLSPNERHSDGSANGVFVPTKADGDVTGSKSAPISRSSSISHDARGHTTDLAASLQAFCRSHCCPFETTTKTDSFKQRKVASTEQDEKVDSSIDQLGDSKRLTSKDGSRPNEETEEEDDGEITDDFSLGDLHLANASGTDVDFTSSEADFVGRISISDEAYVNSKNIVLAKEPQAQHDLVPVAGEKDDTSMQKSDVKGQSLKNRLCQFFGQTTPNIPPKTSGSTILDRKLTEDQRPKSLSDDVFKRDSKLMPIHQSSEASQQLTKHSSSTKAVQLIKWRDLPGKDEYNSRSCLLHESATSPSVSVASTGSFNNNLVETSARGSDIVNFLVEQQALNQTSDSSEDEIFSDQKSVNEEPHESRHPSLLASDFIASTVF